MPYNEDRPLRPENSQDGLVWKIAIGFALGTAIVGLFGFALRLYLANKAVEQFNESMLQISRQSQLSAQAYQARTLALHQAALDSDNREKKKKAEAQRVEELLKRQLSNEIVRKETAWSRFYRKPAECDKAEGQAFMDCANGYIRAKRQFEDQYAKGVLLANEAD